MRHGGWVGLREDASKVKSGEHPMAEGLWLADQKTGGGLD